MRKTAYLLIGSLAFLAACGGQPTSEPLSREDAQVLKASIVEGDRYLLASLGNPGGLLSGQALPGPVVQLFRASGLDAQSTNCVVSTSPSNPQDQDGDGLPLQATYSVDCQSGNMVLRGRMTLRDKDDANPRGGYVLETDYYELRIGVGTPGEKRIKLDLDVDLGPRGAVYDSRLNFYFELYESGRLYSYRRNYAATYAPDNSNNPFGAGTFNYSGVLEYRTPSRYYRLESVASNLRYLQSCSLTFVGGVLSLTDSQGNRLILSYNGCGNVTATYNSQPL